MIFKPQDFEYDYVTKEKAAEYANKVLQEYAKQHNICFHPVDRVRARRSGFDLWKCVWECEACGQKVEITTLKTVPSPKL